MKPRVTWTYDMRTALMLLRMQTKYNDQAQVTAIFNDIFAEKLRESGYENGLKKKKLVDAWNSRKFDGRGREWLTVEEPPRDEREMQHHLALLRQIHQTAINLGINEDEEGSNREANNDEDDDNDNDGEGDAGEDHVDGDNSQGGEDGQIGDAMEVTEDYMKHSGEASREDEDILEVSTDQTLEMVHAGRHSWAGRILSFSSNAFIHHEASIYKLGGRMYCVLIDGAKQDVMICNHSQCESCGETIINPNGLDKSAGQTEGLPFVHAADLEVRTHVGFVFKQDTSNYDEKYPEHMCKERVTFSDGLERDVMVCTAANCEHCSGGKLVNERVTRYLPGGELYELKKIIEEGSIA